MNSKNRILSACVASTLLLSVGMGSAMAVESAPAPAPVTSTVPTVDLKSPEATAARNALEAKIKAEYLQLSAEKTAQTTKVRAQIADIEAQYAKLKDKYAADVKAAIADSGKVRENYKNKSVAYQNAKLALTKKLEALEKENKVRKDKRDAAERADRIAGAKEYKAAKTADQKRKVSGKYHARGQERIAEIAKDSKRYGEVRDAGMKELSKSSDDLRKAEEANRKYGDSAAKVSALTVQFNKDVKPLTEQLNAARKALETYEGTWKAKLSEAEKRWKAERVELEAKIRAGAFTPAPTETEPAPTPVETGTALK